ncbi:MAG: hypothetical protein ACOY3Y_04035, partial [Acidobacteriota bacterium]
WGGASWMAIVMAAILVSYLVLVPLSKAGAADEPAPPTAVMKLPRESFAGAPESAPRRRITGNLE